MTILSKKHCPKCKNNSVFKWGFKEERQRYYCKNCKQTFTVSSKKKSIARQIIWFKKWIIGKRTLKELKKEKEEKKNKNEIEKKRFRKNIIMMFLSITILMLTAMLIVIFTENK